MAHGRRKSYQVVDSRLALLWQNDTGGDSLQRDVVIHRWLAFGGPAMERDWHRDLECWLGPFLKALGNKTRRLMCPAYVAGLIGPGDRKSVQPMAAKADDVSYDRLHHFISAGIWDSAPLEAELWRQADGLVGGEDAWLIVDDTSLPKKGQKSELR